MARRVGTGANINEDEDFLTGLSFLQQIANRGSGEEIDASGTSGEPSEFLSQVGAPKYEDVRQNSYLNNLRNIAQLPNALSGDEDVRRDAAESMMQPAASLPPGIQEEELEGLSGALGAADASKNVNVPISGIPRTKSGALIDPLEAIRMSVENDPSLLAQLPEETRQKLAATPADRERPFQRQAEAAQQVEDIGGESTLPPEARPGDELINPRLEEARAAEGQMPPVVPPDQPITEEMVADFPDPGIQAGAIEQVTSDDLLMKDLQALANGDIPPEQLEMAKQWQEISQKRRDLLDAEEQSLLTKAEEGGLSTLEKIALGIAIAAPILIALRYGGEAGLAAAGGGLESFGKVYGAQQKEGADKLGRLQEIQKERAAEAEKSLDINKKLLDSIPDKAARGFLKGKKIMKIGNQTGISTGDEGKALWLDASKFDTSDEGIKRAREVTKEADETIGVMKDSNRVVNDLLDIMDQIPANTNIMDALKKSVQGVTGVKGPTIDVIGADGKVKKVDALAQMKQKINLLQDLYNKQILGGTRLTGNVVTHWGGILGDPTSISDWVSQDFNTFKDTTRSLKDIMNSREVESLVGKGFLREPLEQQFPFGQNQVAQSEENVFQQMRENPDAFRKKVK